MARRTIPPRSCLICGATFWVRPSIVARGSGKYCTNACRSIASRTHGETINHIHSAEYVCWRAIRDRCLNPASAKYPDYGARGITVCDAWRDSFDTFLSDVGRRPSPKHSIDRWPNNNGSYEVGNVRWATMAEQNRNKRDTVFLTHGEKTHCVAEWARILGMDKTTLHFRLKKGWSVERALTTPVRRWP